MSAFSAFLWKWTFRKGSFQAIALLAFATGLGLAIYSMIRTQQDSERPAVSATFDSKTNILSATAEGLSTDDRLSIIVRGYKEVPDRNSRTGYRFQYDPRSLYFAAIGPGSDGKVTQTINVYVPSRYPLARVKAFTGLEETPCATKETRTSLKIPQRLKVGCFVLRLPPGRK